MKEVVRELISKGLVYGLGSSLNNLVSFLLIPFYTQYLYAAEYGRYALAEMVLLLMLVLLGLGLHVALLARYPQIRPEDRGEYISSALGLVLISTVVLEALFLMVMGLVGSSILPTLDIKVFLLIAAISAIESIWLLVATIYRAEGLAWHFIIASFLQVGLGLVATVGFIAGLGFRDEGILWGRLLGDGLLFGVIVLPRLMKYRLSLNIEWVRDLLKVGLPLIPATLATMWLTLSPRYLVEWFGSTSDVGVFAISSKVANVITMVFVGPFSMVWLVVMFKVFLRPDAERIYARVLTYYILVGGTLTLALGVAAPRITSLLGKETFPLSSEVIVVMALVYAVSGLMYPLIIGPYVYGVTHKVVPIFVFSAVMYSVVGWFMTESWGVQGAIGSLLVVVCVQSYLLGRQSYALYPVPFEWGRIVKVASALAGSFFLTQYLSSFVTNRGVVAWLAVPVFIVVTLFLLSLFRFYDAREANSISRTVNILLSTAKSRLK